MISVTEAKKIIRDTIVSLPLLQLPLADAAGNLLAEDCIANNDMPSFDQSSMDGYAIRSDHHDTKLQLQGVIPAGHLQPETILPGKTFRIFTGAPVPENTYAVIMQEKVIAGNGLVAIDEKDVQKGL